MKRHDALRHSALILMLGFLTFVLAYQIRLPALESQLRTVRQADLDAYVSNLKSYLNKHSTIAVLLAKSDQIAQLISTPDNKAAAAAELSSRLRKTAIIARAEYIDLLRFDATKTTSILHSPAHTGLNNQVEKKDQAALIRYERALDFARQGRLGRQTIFIDGEAHYVFAAPISAAETRDSQRGIIGAVLYVLSMEFLQEQWTASPNIIDVYDANDQLLMNNRERVSATGSNQVQRRQRDNRAELLSIAKQDTELGWRIVLHYDDQDERLQATVSALMIALLVAIAGMLVAFFFYRRQQLLAQLNWQDAQAQLLEEKVEERTQALAKANEQLKAMQDELLRSEKMSLLGRVSASISHEISQPLSAMDVSIRNIRQFMTHNNIEAALSSLKRVDKLNFRMVRIIQNLRAFARNEPTQTRIIDIAALCREAISEFVQSQHDADNVVQMVVAEADIRALAGEVRLLQVIVNVLQNAWRAVEQQETPRIALQVSASGALVWIDIRDNGEGVPETLKKDIFEAFVTTRDGDGSGTGLGLSVAQSFISSMDGALSLVTEPLPEEEAAWLESSLQDQPNQAPLTGAHFRIQLLRASFDKPSL